MGSITTRRSHSRAIAISVAFVPLCLSSCATVDITELRNDPGYVAGVADGCATVQESDKSFSTRRVRDENAFDSDRAYQAGWRAGLLQCKRDYDDRTSTGGGLLGEDQNY